MDYFLDCSICLLKYDIEERTPFVATCGHGLCKLCHSKINNNQNCCTCNEPVTYNKNFAIFSKLIEADEALKNCKVGFIKSKNKIMPMVRFYVSDASKMLEDFLLEELPPFMVQSLIYNSKNIIQDKNIESILSKLSDLRAVKDKRLVFKVQFSSKVIVNRGEVARMPNFYYEQYYCSYKNKNGKINEWRNYYRRRNDREESNNAGNVNSGNPNSDGNSSFNSGEDGDAEAVDVYDHPLYALIFPSKENKDYSDNFLFGFILWLYGDELEFADELFTRQPILGFTDHKIICKISRREKISYLSVTNIAGLELIKDDNGYFVEKTDYDGKIRIEDILINKFGKLHYYDPHSKTVVLFMTFEDCISKKTYTYFQIQLSINSVEKVDESSQNLCLNQI